MSAGGAHGIEMTYYRRLIDEQLLKWKDSARRKPLIVRGARQVGKSSAVRELGRHFRYFAEINLEKHASLGRLFTADIDVRSLCDQLSAAVEVPIVAGETLLFIDEIQLSREAMMCLRYFKEDYPELHVIAAGSLLEFALGELSSFAVGRVRSLYMYPFSFDEFLSAQGMEGKLRAKGEAGADKPLSEAVHRLLRDQLRTFYLVGGMPQAVGEWIETHDYAACRLIHNDILEAYQDDFAKYKKRVQPLLLRQVLRSVALQSGRKFVFSQAADQVRAAVVSDALRLLALAGLVVPVTHSDANGVPLGAEEDGRYTKYLFVDVGLMLTMLSVSAGDVLLSTDNDLVNRGAVSEVFAGLELMKYQDCFARAELHYWQNNTRNGQAEVDYLLVAEGGRVVPVEVKANTRGSMQSMYLFLRKKHLPLGVRLSMENFARFTYVDHEDGEGKREVRVVPLHSVRHLLASLASEGA